MKKIIISLIVIMLFLINANQVVYAADTWVSDAFSAADDFMHESPTDDWGIINPLLNKFRNIVKGVNRVLLVLLGGISIIALSIVGVRYMFSGADPSQKKAAKESLHTVFIGMIYGFGAFVIWNIAMGIVNIIIKALAQ